MADYECMKCGLTGWSKNIQTRSLFTHDTISSMMCTIVNVATEENDKGLRVVTFEFPYMDSADWKDKSRAELEQHCCKLIRDLTEEQLVHWLCDHKWKHTGGDELQSSW